MYSIYKITCVATGKFYVGQTNDLQRRINVHKRCSEVSRLRKAVRDAAAAGLAFEQAFTTEVLYKTPNPITADSKEIYYIKTLQATKRGNYNYARGGRNRRR
jgi:group I intron endonuclease